MKIDLTQRALIELALLHRIDILNREEGAEVFLQKTKSLLTNIQLGNNKFSSFEKALFTGCLREKYVYPKEDLFKLNNIEIFKNLEKYYNEFIFLNDIYNIIERLNSKNKNQCEYADLVKDMLILKKCEKVYYSKSNDKIYKLAIMKSKNKGFYFDLDNTRWNFKLIEINKDNYKHEGSLKDILIHIESYNKHYVSYQSFLELF
ncbi:hypothetical protein [Myroides profundi]|uniref:Uncharacterized protein n=1 Tax=Myroides profundi TaxID=480520 RepID=A0AAJ4W6K2_MYRPR|nr:hypothetical protein [Myroides profundi]AJH15578.1 hypothetical protein MPR_2407 [Myroides profundi]SER52537.1 hypothetical protein SAMN04488089_11815 [Myroides profundi]